MACKQFIGVIRQHVLFKDVCRTDLALFLFLFCSHGVVAVVAVIGVVVIVVVVVAAAAVVLFLVIVVVIMVVVITWFSCGCRHPCPCHQICDRLLI